MLETSSLIDVALGLCVVFALTSVLCSTIWEAAASRLQFRQKGLVDGVRNLCEGIAENQPGGSNGVSTDHADSGSGAQAIVAEIMNHPVVKSMRTPGKMGPSYLPAPNFAVALLDTVEKVAEKTDGGATSLSKAIEALPACQLRDTLTVFLKEVQGDRALLQARVEAWYDDAMDRVSGWYKRRTRFWLLIFGFVVALAFNIDTIAISKALWNDPALRQEFAQKADELARDETLDPEEVKKELDVLFTKRPIPVGWQPAEDSDQMWQIAWQAITTSFYDQPSKLIGFAISAIAVSLGSDFWFELLKRLVNLRAAGGVPTRRQDGAGSASSVSPGNQGATAVEDRPESAFEAGGLNSDDIKDIQRALGLTGRFVTGAVDANTRTMIEEFQIKVGRRPTGVLTPYLVERILAPAE